MAEPPEVRSMRARWMSHKSWADMPDPADRRKRTAAARRNSPVTFEYHLDRVPAEITDPAARLKAAKSAHAAHMSKLAYARAKKRAEREAGEQST
jgi:hypothetical protein